MYVDTTFCVPQALYIPTRQDSVTMAATIIEEWLKEDPSNYILISFKASLGYEHLFVEISKYFDMPVSLLNVIEIYCQNIAQMPLFF